MNLAPLGIAALVPLMLGTAPVVGGPGRLVAALCGGHVVVIPLPHGRALPPCTIKACHAACTRRFLDPEQ